MTSATGLVHSSNYSIKTQVIPITQNIMPVAGLPFMLENLLKITLDTHSLSSWQIMGDEYITQITLRFGNGTQVKESVNYRRASPLPIAHVYMRASVRRHVYNASSA